MSSDRERYLKAMDQWLENQGRFGMWADLKLKSDAELEALGYSPELVKKGLDYWPWGRTQSTPDYSGADPNDAAA